MDKRMEARATTPRYTVTRASELVGRPPNTIRRWSLGHRRKYQDQIKVDDPLIEVDGPSALPLSFLNLLELQLLSHYRDEAALQAIRRALDFTAKELEIPRPLISIKFKVRGGELFTKFAETSGGQELLLNASRGGRQITVEKLVGGVAITDDVDYDNEIIRRWWFRSRAVPLYVDTQVASGHPITAETGVRMDAIASRHRDGYSNTEISEDTGATGTEVVAAILAA